MTAPFRFIAHRPMVIVLLITGLRYRVSGFEAIEIDSSDAKPYPGIAPHCDLTLNLDDHNADGV